MIFKLQIRIISLKNQTWNWISLLFLCGTRIETIWNYFSEPESKVLLKSQESPNTASNHRLVKGQKEPDLELAACLIRTGTKTCLLPESKLASVSFLTGVGSHAPKLFFFFPWHAQSTSHFFLKVVGSSTSYPGDRFFIGCIMLILRKSSISG